MRCKGSNLPVLYPRHSAVDVRRRKHSEETVRHDGRTGHRRAVDCLLGLGDCREVHSL